MDLETDRSALADTGRSHGDGWMQKVVPGILFVFGLTVVALFSDMAGVTLRRLRGSTDPVPAQADLIPTLATPGEAYRPALTQGGIPPH